MPLSGAANGRLWRFAEIQEGQEFSAQEKFEEAALDRFAQLSGDLSRLHTDSSAAIAHGYPGRLVYGFHMACLLSRIVGQNLEDAVCGAVSLDFVQPAFAGDTVTLRATAVQIQAALRSVVLKVQIFAEERLVVRGRLTVVFLPEQE